MDVQLDTRTSIINLDEFKHKQTQLIVIGKWSDQLTAAWVNDLKTQ
jgi:hypothetical protein